MIVFTLSYLFRKLCKWKFVLSQKQVDDLNSGYDRNIKNGQGF